MIESHSNNELEKKIDRYVNGQLSEEEIDELWAELVQDGEKLDYLKTVANTRAVLESEQKEARIFSFKQSWAYAAAAVVILLIGVLTIMNYPEVQTSSVEPITSIELDYYRSEEGVVNERPEAEVLKNALALANSGNTQDAIQMLEQELQASENPSWSAELYLNIGSLHYNSGDYQLAIQNFKEVVSKDQAEVLVREKGYWYLGNAYFQLNQLDEARSAIEDAYELNGAYRRVAKHYLDALASA